MLTTSTIVRRHVFDNKIKLYLHLKLWSLIFLIILLPLYIFFFTSFFLFFLYIIGLSYWKKYKINPYPTRILFCKFKIEIVFICLDFIITSYFYMLWWWDSACELHLWMCQYFTYFMCVNNMGITDIQLDNL